MEGVESLQKWRIVAFDFSGFLPWRRNTSLHQISHAEISLWLMSYVLSP